MAVVHIGKQFGFNPPNTNIGIIYNFKIHTTHFQEYKND